MTTAVFWAGNVTSSKSLDASAVIKVAFDIWFAVAFSRAETIEAPAISIPIEEEKRDESVTVNRPEPQYASIRYWMDFASLLSPAGIMWSRI